MPDIFKVVQPDWSEGAGGGNIFSALGDLVTGGGDQGRIEALAGNMGPSSKAPKLVPMGTGIVDIRKTFKWTGSQSNIIRDEVPRLFLREKIVNRSSRLQNIMYNFASLSQSPVGDVVFTAAGAAIGGQIGEDVSDSGFGGFLGKIVGGAGGFLAGNVIGGAAESFIDNTPGERYTNNLSSYSGLYSTTPTGWVYDFPFIRSTEGVYGKRVGQRWEEAGGSAGDALRQIGNTAAAFMGDSRAGSLAKGIGAAGGVFDAGQEALKYIFAGAGAETAKSYQYGQSDQYNVNINFYLFNNISPEETKRNWSLVYLLSYQNLPNRLNRLVFTPPVIYEAQVPGVFYSMYSYISELQVDYLGSRISETMKVKVANFDSSIPKNISNIDMDQYGEGVYDTEITAIIPEIYKVSLTLTSLLPESQNLIHEAHFNSQNYDVPESRGFGASGSLL